MQVVLDAVVTFGELPPIAWLVLKLGWLTQLIGGPLALATAVLTGLLIFNQGIKCLRLLNRLNRGTARGRWYRVLGTVLGIFLPQMATVARDRRTLLRMVRMRAEHELFDQRPEFRWPRGDEVIDLTGNAGAYGRAARRMARASHRREVRAWRKRMRRVLAGGHQIIEVENPALINEQLAKIQYYFRAVRSIGETGGEAGSFICPIRITTGFIAPIHLSTGLLATFNDTWEPILRAFNRDANDSRLLAPRQRSGRNQSGNVRQIQMFIYNCWLLWGPSIPVCTGRLWWGDYQVVQYGFGDENNSIEIAGRNADIRDFLDKLVQAQTTAARPMALPARVTGQLRLSLNLTNEDDRPLGGLPLAALQSWGHEMNERPVLFVSEILQTSAIAATSHRDQLEHGDIQPDPQALTSRYYSAYLWVGFVLLRERDGVWMPLSRHRGEVGRVELWQDFVPFFEHGNLADAETCVFGKRQLASKAIAGIAGLMRDWEGAPSLRFAFACAIDECGCQGSSHAHPQWRGAETMRALLCDAIEAGAGSDPIYARMRDDSIVVFDHFDEAPEGNDYAACQLPGHIRGHYKHMGLEG